jgi:hypothetical protein
MVSPESSYEFDASSPLTKLDPTGLICICPIGPWTPWSVPGPPWVVSTPIGGGAVECNWYARICRSRPCRIGTQYECTCVTWQQQQSPPCGAAPPGGQNPTTLPVGTGPAGCNA